MIRIKAQALEDLVRDIFIKAGCSEAEGKRIGKYLVIANLTGTTATASSACRATCSGRPKARSSPIARSRSFRKRL